MCDLDEQKIIQKMLDDFCDLTGLAAVINNTSGEKLTKLSNVSEYCEIMRAKGNLCCTSDDLGAKIAVDSGGTSIYICHAGLVDLALPILVEGEHVGSIMAGQVRCKKKLDFDLSSNLSNLFEIDDRLKVMFEDIPFMNLEQLERSARVLEIMRKYIVERMENKKNLMRDSNRIGITDKFESFRSKSSKIADSMRCVDYTKSMRLLNELYSEIIEVEKNDANQRVYMSLMKSELRTLEMIIPEYDDIIKYDNTVLVHTNRYWVYYTKLVDYLFEDIILKKRFRVADELDYAIAYTQRFYYCKLSIADVANIVNLSTDYFARLFKRRVSTTFVEYLKHRKISASKNLLRHTDLNINEIAMAIGYEDSNYFTRVFKKLEGVSPKKFRVENDVS